jgi:hypothetical protein
VAEIHEHTTTDSGSGVASGMVLGIVLVVLVLAVAAFMFFGGAFRGAGPATTTPNTSNPTNVQINPPAAPPKVDVNVNPPSGGSSGSSQPAPSKP